MGTTFSVKFTSQEHVNLVEIENDVNALLEKVNQQMSTYIPNSEISLFNKSISTDWINVSYDLAFVMNAAIKISQISNGQFDITIGPLVNLWGFGPENKPLKVPSDSDIKNLRSFVGYKNIDVKLNPPSIRKLKPNVYCDLSAIAKGFGVDKISEYLTSKNLKNHLVEIGGELRASGTKFDKKWQIGISVPTQSIIIQETISLENQSMATSGDYWNYFEENGVRYSHTINPITGKPITHKLASVTIVAESCMEADAIATAIDVMGAEAGLKFAEDNELKVYFIVKGEDDFEIFITPQFNNLISKGN
ncbi:MAG: FAD:protein FMN transferase [Melioribacteraceae bacterium]|nr:FAD:protein FMN transferase [Melioribacteraceae bacterium]